MSRSRMLERVVLVALVAGVGIQAWSLRSARTRLRDQEQRTLELELKVKTLDEARKARALLPPPEMFEPAPQPAANARMARGGRGGRGARAGDPGDPAAEAVPRPGPGARARAATPQVPGARVVNLLYDAADAMAAEEDWDAATYDDVSRVFDRTTGQMLGLVDSLKSGDMAPREVRRRAILIRNDATDELADILGADGLDKLKEHLKDEMPPWAARR